MERWDRICSPKIMFLTEVQNRAGVEAGGVWSWLGELSPVWLLVNQVAFGHTHDRVFDTSFYCINEDTSLKSLINSVMKYNNNTGCLLAICGSKSVVLSRVRDFFPFPTATSWNLNSHNAQYWADYCADSVSQVLSWPRESLCAAGDGLARRRHQSETWSFSWRRAKLSYEDVNNNRV